jgi:3-dehydroquinate synthase
MGGASHCALIEFPAGEASKSRQTWAELTDNLLDKGFGRDAVVVALGGGVTGDLAGFVAATYLRGVSLVQVPTTLLAMIDSSVGGKTGVDTRHGKNLVGAFHQPRVVVADVTTLSTLSDRHIRAGIVEAIKHGAIADPDYFHWVTSQCPALLDRNSATLTQLVKRSIEIKATVVAEDEREQGVRAILNFGHTVAHALEAASHFELIHGEAVALGMLAEAHLGECLGVTTTGTADAVRESLAAAGLPTQLPPSMDTDRALRLLATDKKSRMGSVRFALLAHIGGVAMSPDGEWTQSATDSAIQDAFRHIV